MYTNFYNLKSKPFTLLPDPEYLFLSQKHKTALMYLEYGLMDQTGFIVITGEIGTGKTTLTKYFLNKLDDTTRVAYIFNTNITPDQFLKSVTQELEIPSSDGDKTQVLGNLNQFLIHEYASRHKVILIVDEAQNLSLQTLEEIRMLSNLQTEKDYLLQIVLIGQPSLRDKLRHPQLKQFSQRITVNYHLVPLNLEETTSYIRHRLEVSQARDLNLFTEEALKVIFQHSKGVPRLINILCDASLVYGFAEELKTIDEKIVEQVIADKRQGGIFDVKDDSKTVEFSDLGPNGSDGFEYRISALEQAFSDLQQTVLSTIHNFSQLMANNTSSQTNNGLTAEVLTKMLMDQRKTDERLTHQYNNLKKELEDLRKTKEALEGEINNLKKPITKKLFQWLRS